MFCQGGAVMDSSRSYIHFHIRWREKDSLDWECFETHDASHTRALALMLTGETFEIVEVSMNCPLRSLAAGS